MISYKHRFRDSNGRYAAVITRRDPSYFSRRELRGLIILFLVGILIGIFILTFVFENIRVQKTSMFPTYRDGQMVGICKIFAPKPGDVVVIHSPTEEGALYIKRVVSMGGETVWVDEEGYLCRQKDGGDAVIRTAEPYVNPACASFRFSKTHVPKGYMFVLGDNRSESYDSTEFGPIPQSLLYGVVIINY